MTEDEISSKDKSLPKDETSSSKQTAFKGEASSYGEQTRPVRPPYGLDNTSLSSHRRPSPQQPTRVPSSPSAGPTRAVRPSAFGRQQPTVQQPPPSPPPAYRPTVVAAPRQRPARRRINWFRWLVRGLALLSLMLILLGVLALSGSVLTYFWIAARLPSAEELRARSFHFATTQILDRDGNLLWEIIDPTGGRRTSVNIDQISPDLINATIATEDRFF